MKWRAVYVAILLGIGLTGCVKKELSPTELASLIPGLSTEDAARAHYAFEGTRGGYGVVAKLELGPAAMKKVLEGVTGDPDGRIPGESEEYFLSRLSWLGYKTPPKWFDFSNAAKMKVFQRKGSNSWTSEFIYSYHVDQEAGVIWVEGGGI